MKYIKKYENRFTNFFKTGDTPWQDTMDDYMGSKLKTNRNALMSAAEEGNWKKFKNLLPHYKNKINEIEIEYNDDNTKSFENILIKVIKGNGDLWEKKKMLSVLFDNNIDFNFVDEKGKTFFDYVNDVKLKKWLEENYPEVVSQLTANKYNL